MAICYKKLFKLLIDRDLKRKNLRDMTGVSYATLQKLERGENVMTDVLNTICLALGCGLDDIAEIIPDEPDKKDFESAPMANVQNAEGEKTRT